MNLDELKEKLKTDLEATKNRLEENSTYVNLRDRFASLNPLLQKAIMVGVSVLLILLVLAIPYGTYETSVESEALFDSRRALLRDLYQVQKQIAETPQIQAPPSMSEVKSMIDSNLQGSGLLPEQIKEVSTLPAINNDLVKASQNEGIIEVSLGQLNVKQVVDIGSQLQSLNSSIKLKDLVMKADAKDNRYFDVIYRLLVLKVTAEAPEPQEEPKKKGKR